MLIVGLTGGVASGKSLVSQAWREEGAYVIDADQIARELVQPGTPAWREIVKVFGKEILEENGTIHRKRLAARIFTNPAERELLNRILHPRIKREVDRRIKEIAKGGSEGAVVVIDAALLIETGYHRRVDRVVVVTSREGQQVERLKKRDQLDETLARRIIEAQMSQDDRIEVADVIICNEGPMEETKRRAKEVFEELRKAALRKRG